ncbi:CocE/NonD family hydrolase [Mycobacterium branderi]|uniref:Hydrolase n=1 Tax=Mycobacterium branderi TaxID=43348 RepID=A0A7I7W606_9MYCO|nr:CocE/NonD family hydrolase [Mycobacterium branderi]MCV7231961.1 CocE/NonD family hydrolase [Mycobacterium branderi]ORA34804.1 hydrolase [Mycobacterium branderi]BBZ12500.1 hydrolase [Mycobacterium branderi]
MARSASPDAPAHDRPWKRPGAVRYAVTRLRGFLRAPVDVYVPEPGAVVVHDDVAVTTRDGTVLRVNVYLPPDAGPFPVLLCAHPYGKDKLPKKRGRGYAVPFQYRLLRQPSRLRFSTLTTWEAPDPAWWTAHGFAVVNCDLRGAGQSDGIGSLLSDQEGEDVYDLVEWAAEQPWSTGAVGMIGVSYLAISQWKAAALRPPHLRAIVPWEGFTDAYRDLARPGGIREVGFISIWSRGLKSARLKYRLSEEVSNRPLRDEFWRSLVPDLAKIEVPALICGSFSDNNLHSRGSMRGFEQIGSAERHLYTHRGGKWTTFYSESALQTQLAFLNRHLRDVPGEPLPRVRLEVRDDRDHIAQVRDETSWPPESTVWTALHLTDVGLRTDPAERDGSITFDTRSGGARFGWTVPADTEITGPMALRLFVEVAGGDDVDLFVGIEKWCGTTFVPFEGAYGFGRDRITCGWLKASMRALDETRSRPFEPVPRCDARDPLPAGQVVQVDIPLGPSATLFRAGEQLRLVVAGRWLWPRNPLTGQFPAAYERGPRTRCTLHWGPERDPRLLIPVIPR